MAINSILTLEHYDIGIEVDTSVQDVPSSKLNAINLKETLKAQGLQVTFGRRKKGEATVTDTEQEDLQDIKGGLAQPNPASLAAAKDFLTTE